MEATRSFRLTGHPELIAELGCAQDLHLRLEIMDLSYCPTLLPRQKIARTKEWSGWQELNLRGHVPKTCGWPLPYTRIVGEGLSALSCLSLNAHDLAQRVHHVHQIALRLHHGIDGLVRHRGFVDDVRVLTALDAGSCLGVIVQREAALRFRT